MRRYLLPLLFLVVGIEAGILLDHFLLWKRRIEPAPLPPAASESVPMAPPVPVPVALTGEASATFNGNIYPSLVLSLGSAYPEYRRCLTVVVNHAPVGRQCEVRIESDLFQQPLIYAATVPSDKFDLNPDLPWNYDALRKVSQSRPELFVISISVKNQAVVQSVLTCTVHPVNEAVSRVYDSTTGEWQDTSVCFAAFVNEDNPWIATFLQEALGRDGVQRFSGYELGTQTVLPQIQAIWDTLAARGLRYVDLATMSGGVPEVTTQYVRFLDQSVSEQGANCVDASAMLASIFRRIGLRPVLLFKPGHCFVAVYDAAQGGQLIALETTMLGAAPFASAQTFGGQELQTTQADLSSPGYSSVDIALARQEGVMPIGD